MCFLVYPFDEDRKTMIQDVKVYYKGLEFNVDEQEEKLIIDWS